VATTDHLAGMAIDTGKTIWKTPLHESRRDRQPARYEFKKCESGVAVFDVHSGLMFVDERTGSVAWRYHPRGRIQSHWGVSSERIALQTLRPDMTCLIAASRQRNVIEFPGLPQAWRAPPVIDLHSARTTPLYGLTGSGDIVLISDTRRIESYSTETALVSWSFSGGLSYAYVDPVLWRHGERLFVTMDGTTLSEIDTRTGSPLWASGIAESPLVDPSRQVTTNGEAAFAASRGLLRAVSLQDGTQLWRRFIGEDQDQWQVAVCGGNVAAWPVSNPKAITWCNVSNGQPLQKSKLPDQTRRVKVEPTETGCLVISDSGIRALRSMNQ
jgi:outer membrane protein assembly factor BamB